MTLTFNLHGWMLRSTHCLVIMNICTKYYLNLSRPLQNMERTCKFDEILSIWPLTSRYDLDLGPTWPNDLLCTLSCYCEYLYQILSKSSKAFTRYGAHTKVWWNTVYMTFDLPVWPWPRTNMAKCFALHIILSLWTFVLNMSNSVKVLARYGADMQIWWNIVYIVFDLPVWPWPWISMAECFVLHIVLLLWTFVQILSKSVKAFARCGVYSTRRFDEILSIWPLTSW